MDFYEVLTKAIEILQREGRTSYRALKRQFELDDEYLEDLKLEIVRVKQLALDQDGEMLVWTGEVGSPEPDAQRGTEDESHFHAMLSAVMWWLQRDGRITYRTLKHILGLDGALLDEIRRELTFRQVARDESGEGLVWIGETQPLTPSGADISSQPNIADTTEITSPAAPTPLSITEPHMPSNGPKAPAESISTDVSQDESTTPSELPRTAPEAERRQLTVMFCDLADSTKLSQQLDPEDLREVIRAYQQTSAEVIQRFDGYTAQHLGDGLLIYFGWPRAHEDDAQRALHAGLGIVEAITTSLNPRLEPKYGVQLTVRLGVHTGPVVVGEMGSDGRQENLATGETVNISARLEGLAQPNTVVVSSVTERLVRGVFELEDLGPHELKGVAEPMQIFRVLSPTEVHRDPDESLPDGGVFLVGRDEEIGLLLRRWEQSKDGLGQVVLISGEAGIGKSSLVATMRQHVMQEESARITFRCSPYHTNSALHPVITHLEQMLGFDHNDTPGTKLDKLEQTLGSTSLPLEESVPLVATLLSMPLEDRYPTLAMSPQQQRQHTLDTLVAWLIEESEKRPVLAVWEDLHWADPSTLEMLGLVLEQTPTVPMLHVLTFRPEFSPPWPTRSHMTPITLNRLERAQVEALITHMADDKPLPKEVVEHIVAKTDGVPLYVEELTKMLLASELLKEGTDQYVLTGSLSSVAIPDTLQDSLMARLDQLNQAKEVAQLGAVLGREFAYDFIQAISSQDEASLQANLGQLVEAELLYQRGRPPRARYIFKHALIQDTAYASLLRSQRQQYHAQVVTLLESQHIETIDQSPDVIARHCMEASLYERSAHYWDRAGQALTSRCANQEAVTCFEQALRALSCLSESQSRLEHEFDTMLALRAVLFPLQEFHRVFTCLQQAEQLAERLGDERRLGRVLGYQGLLLWATRRYQEALDVGHRALDLATQNQDIGMTIITKNVLCRAYCYLGDYPHALSLCTESIDTLVGALEYESFGMTGLASVHARRWYGLICAETGDFSEGKKYAREAVKIAESSAHSHTIVAAYYGVGTLDFRQGNLQKACEILECAWTICLTEDLRVFFLEIGSELGSVYASLGRLAEALELQEKTVEQHEFDISRRLIALSETYLQLGRLEEACEHAQEGVRLAKDGHESGFLAWGLRLLGNIAMHRDPPEADQAKTHYRESLALANELGMRPLQAHCHRGLGMLYSQTGQSAKASTELSTAIEMYQEMEMTLWLSETEAALADVER